MDSFSCGVSPPPTSDADEVKKFLDGYDDDSSESERLVLFRDDDGQVHVIRKKINKFEGFWAKIGASRLLLRGLGIAVDANIKHVLRYLNDKKISDPRLKKLVDGYNAKRKRGLIRKKDFPYLFPAIESSEH